MRHVIQLVKPTLTMEELITLEGLNYFFNTNAPKKVPEKITSQRMFDKYFSPATTMGKGGEATEIKLQNSLCYTSGIARNQ